MTIPKPPANPLQDYYKNLDALRKKPQTLQQQMQNTPNSEKLTNSERSMYQGLAGVPKGWMDAAEKVGNSWIGKGLMVFDALAEPVERGIGTAYQYATRNKAEEFDFKDAWNAGSLSYDVANMPIFSYKPETTGEKILSTFPAYTVYQGIKQTIETHEDLPGMAYLATVRKQMAAGMTVDEAKNDLYSNLGALALRSQLNDTMGHIVADPLNALLAWAKPITRIKAIAGFARSGKVSLEVAQEALVANKIKEAGLRAAGNVGEADKYLKAITTLEDVVKNYDLLPATKRITSVDKIAMFLVGDPLEAKKLAKLNPLRLFQLTPESKALEAVNVLEDNIGTYIIANHLDDPKEAMVALNRANSGAIDPATYGMGLYSKTGQQIQGYMGGITAKANDMYKAFDVVKDERTILKSISDVLGESEPAVLKRMTDDPSALFKLFSEHPLIADLDPGILNKIMADGEEGLSNIAGILKDTPYTNRLFMLEMKNMMAEVVMRQAIMKYGVGEAKLITRYNNMIKAAESLAYMRLSPSYLLRNFVNNEFTMAARGLFGSMPIDKIDEFWEGVGWIPSRLTQGFGVAGVEAGARVGKAGQILEEAMYPNMKRGVEITKIKGKPAQVKRISNFPEDITEKIRNINLGKFDMVKHGGQIESTASKRAMTSGFLEWKKYAQYSRMDNVLPQSTMQAIKNTSPDLVGKIEEAIHSGLYNKNTLDDIFDVNLNVDFNNVLKDASDSVGFDIKKLVPQDILAPLERDLPNAIKNGNVEQLFSGFRNNVQQHLDELIDLNIENLAGEVSTRVQLGGRPEAARMLGGAIDNWHQGEVEYAIRMSNLKEAIDSARTTGNYDVINSLWRKLEDDSTKYWDRQWKRLDLTIEGAGKGLTDAGVPFPTSIGKDFKGIKTGWQDFYTTRKSLRTEFFDALKNKKTPPKDWDEIQKILDGKYAEMIEQEAKLTQSMDVASSKLIQDPVLRQEFLTSREMMANLKKIDKQKVVEIRELTGKMNPEQRIKAWNTFWKQRQQRYTEMWQLDKATEQMLGGGQEGRQLFKGGKAVKTEVPEGTMLSQMDVDSLIEMGWNGGKKRLFNAVNKDRVAKGLEAYNTVDKVPFQEAVASLETRLDIKPSVADVSKIMPEGVPNALAQDQYMMSRGFDAVDNIELSTKKLMQEKPMVLKDMPQDVQDAAMKYIKQMKGEVNDNRYAAIKFAEFRRDSALLNYNRRTNFDTMVGTLFPFAFWTTGSMQMWALHSIDRPAMLSTFLKTKKFLETAGMQREGMPSRLLGNVRIELPFLPDWMGDQFIDPLKLALPFDSFAQPFEQMQNNKFTVDGRTQRTLSQMLDEGKITQEDYDAAIRTKAGSLWDQAKNQTVKEDENLDFNAWDFASLVTSPHAPLTWAWNAANGHPEDIGPFTSLSRTSRDVATVMGIDDWNNSPINMEAKIRKMMGLPAFDKFDDYRTDRMLSNMAASGEFTVDEIKRAMITREGEAFDEAVKRANQEFTGGVAGAALRLLGLPPKSYPPGEEQQRRLQDDLNKAYEEYDNGDGDPDAINAFYEKNPEYETRLALWKTPEERLQSFLVDNIWSKWNEYPDINKTEISDQLGTEFQELFLDKETRSYSNIPTETLSVWLKLMGGDPPGTLTATDKMMLQASQLKLTDPATANQVQAFYDMRDTQFKTWREVQEGYFDLPESTKYFTGPREEYKITHPNWKKEDEFWALPKSTTAYSGPREEYKKLHPELQRYWDYRRQFMNRNSNIVPYLTDNPKDLEMYEAVANGQEPIFTWEEWKQILPVSVQRVFVDYVRNDTQITQPFMDYLNQLSGKYGFYSGEDMLDAMRSSVR